MTNDRYESAKAAFRETERLWDAEIRKAFGKAWHQLKDIGEAEGEPGTRLNDACLKFKAALAEWVSIANDPSQWWREAKGV